MLMIFFQKLSKTVETAQKPQMFLLNIRVSPFFSNYSDMYPTTPVSIPA